MRIFLSHNMSGLKDEEVWQIRHKAEELIKENIPTAEFIDNYNHPGAPEVFANDTARRLWHLGRSIQQLGTAQMIYFCKESTSVGCIVERLIAHLYGIPVLEMRD